MVQQEEIAIPPAVLSRAWTIWGWEHFCRGQYDTVKQAYDQAIRLDPENFRAYYGLGRYLLRIDMLTEAGSCFERCKELNPRSALGEEGLMLLARRQRRWIQVLKLFLIVTIKSFLNPNDAYL
jgi:tetratricopeptide (TPR) repeat protein